MPTTGAVPTTAVRDTVRRVSFATAAGAESTYTGCGVTVSDSSGASIRCATANGSSPATMMQPHSVLFSNETVCA